MVSLQKELDEEREEAIRLAKKEAIHAAEEAEEREAEQLDVQSGCDPNYAGACVPPYPPDVNCADVGVTVDVIGSDPHGLDGDNDGYGCE